MSHKTDGEMCAMTWPNSTWNGTENDRGCSQLVVGYLIGSGVVIRDSCTVLGLQAGWSPVTLQTILGPGYIVTRNSDGWLGSEVSTCRDPCNSLGFGVVTCTLYPSNGDRSGGSDPRDSDNGLGSWVVT